MHDGKAEASVKYEDMCHEEREKKP